MNYPSKKPHPQGEYLQSKELSSNPRIPVDTYAGRVQVEWDSEAAVTPMGQLSFQFAEIDPKVGVYEYSVLVTNLKDEVMTLATHYRDRGDSENNFDELKNQWG